LFQFVDTKYIKSSKTRSYQVDVYGMEKKGHGVGICECKYTKTKMSIKQLKKLENTSMALKQEAEESGLAVPEIRMWLVSTGGFTREVLEYVINREDIYYSDHEGINSIFRAYGGNYNIPVFNES